MVTIIWHYRWPGKLRKIMALKKETDFAQMVQ